MLYKHIEQILEKESAGLRCCCLKLDRKCREIESCELNQTLTANILVLGYPNLMKFFPEMVNLYSLTMNVLLGHCHNFVFSIVIFLYL